MKRVGETFRIFVSSTFNDLKEERNALQKHVFPKLRELCMKHGCKFQAIDLRWGIREEAALDQQTMKICLEEISRCQKTSPRPNFIVLLGDRHGWCPLPYEIPASEFSEILHNVTNTKDTELLSKWYRRDDNAVPPVYDLQPRTREYMESANWEPIERRLRSILLGAIRPLTLSEKDSNKYWASATEQEILRGALKVKDANDHVFCFFRSFLVHQEDGSFCPINKSPLNQSFRDFVDLDPEGNLDQKAHARLNNLKECLSHMLHGNIHDYKVKWTGNSVTTYYIGTLPDRLEDCLKLIDYDKAPSNLCVDVWRRLSRVILKEIAKLEEIEPLEQEIADHETFGRERAEIFIGRNKILGSISKYLLDDRRQPLAIHGVSGSGKSALLARAFQELERSIRKSRYPKAKIVQRFIGLTPESSNIRSLLKSLCKQLDQTHDDFSFILSNDINRMISDFHTCMKLATSEKPLVIFLDGLDQLAKTENAHGLYWLPIELPAHVKIVVSTQPEPYECLPALKSKIPQKNLLDLQPMSYSEGEKILDLWLEAAGRRLQNEQRKEVLEKFEIGGLPLYLKLAFQEARRWRSYDQVPEYEAQSGLFEDIPGIFGNFLWRLSKAECHGRFLIQCSLGYLAAARDGLSEVEMIDILSRDKDFLEDFRQHAYHVFSGEHLPVVVWSRLYHDLEPYLANRGAKGMSLLTFYHRQLSEVVYSMYLDTKEKRTTVHQSIADYFADQELNSRKVNELPWQLAKMGDWERLKDCLVDLSLFSAVWRKDSDEVYEYWRKIEEYSDWTRLKAYSFVLKNPSAFPESLVSLADLFHYIGRLSEVLILMQAWEKFCRKTHNLEGVAYALLKQGHVLSYRNEVNRSVEMTQEAKEIAKKIDNKLMLAGALGNLAANEEDITGSYDLSRRALELYKDIGDLHGEAVIIGNLGVILSQQNKIEEAMEHLQRAEKLCHRLGSKLDEARNIGRQADIIMREKRDAKTALALSKREEKLLRNVGGSGILTDCLYRQANILRFIGSFSSSIDLIKSVEKIFKKQERDEGIASCFLFRAITYKEMGNLYKALDFLQEASRIYRRRGYYIKEADTMIEQANIYADLGEVKKAMALYKEHERICEQEGETYRLANSLINQAVLLYEHQKPHEEILELLNKAHAHLIPIMASKNRIYARQAEEMAATILKIKMQL